MNNFMLENTAKTFSGKGCVKESPACLADRYGDTVTRACGGRLWLRCKAVGK